MLDFIFVLNVNKYSSIEIVLCILIHRFYFLFLGGPCHPWLFIEEAATKEVGKDFNSVYSRLVLCKTYRLDEDGKVLTPEEVNNT